MEAALRTGARGTPRADGYQIMLSDLTAISMDGTRATATVSTRPGFHKAIRTSKPATLLAIHRTAHGNTLSLEPRLRGDLSAWRQAALREVPDAVTDKQGNPT